MKFDFTHLPRPQQMLVYEAHARGAYLSIACDYEKLMDDLIALCELNKIFPNGYDNKTDNQIMDGIINYKLRLITSLEMGKKLERCKRGLEIYNKEHFNAFNPHFTTISELVKDRNLMTHGYADTEIPQRENEVLIQFENVEKGKKIKKIISFQPFIMQLEKYRNGIMELMELTVTLRIEKFANRHIV